MLYYLKILFFDFKNLQNRSPHEETQLASFKNKLTQLVQLVADTEQVVQLRSHLEQLDPD